MSGVAHLADAEHHVYVIWRDDTPLYVGMTANWEQRFGQHEHFFVGSARRAAATHADVWHVGPGRAAAEAIEAETIRALDPLGNTVHSPRAERRRAEWLWYSSWSDAYVRGQFDHAYRWALEPEAIAHAEAALAANGWSRDEAIRYGFLPDLTSGAA